MHNDEKNRPGIQSIPASSGESPEEGQDNLEKLIQLAREVVYQTPEVGPEKVARLKEAVQQGAYEIDSEKLADILIEELNLKR